MLTILIGLESKVNYRKRVNCQNPKLPDLLAFLTFQPRCEREPNYLFLLLLAGKKRSYDDTCALCGFDDRAVGVACVPTYFIIQPVGCENSRRYC
jgi:hypothetical protein